MEYTIKKASNSTLIEQSLGVALEVFMEFEAPVYPQKGIDSFKRALSNPDYVGNLTTYAAIWQNQIIGMLATRNGGTHIALFFVKSQYHRQGIGRALFEVAFDECKAPVMTVFSSPFAVSIYKTLGFTPTNSEQIDDGIRFTPMEIKKR